MLENEEFTKIVPILRAGGLIIFPTDTIWGIGCDALNEDAIQKIYEIKKRDPKKSLIILVSSQEQLEKYVEPIHPKAQNLIDYYERPLTIVYDKAKDLPDSLLAQDGSLGVRLVKDDFCKTLIEALGFPIVATSANFSDHATPKNFNEIDKKLLAKADYVAEHRREEESLHEPSVVVKIPENGELIILRK